MCGVIGIQQLDGSPIDPPLVAKMAGALAHRGPDECGVSWLNGRSVALAHTRLSIVDLTGGQQPMHDVRGALSVSFNGEIYDVDATRAAFERRGFVFHTRSDTELILAAYALDGLAGFRQLNGEFAFVLWDAHKRRLMAARDGAGIKPLYLLRHGHSVRVASEVKALFVDPTVPRAFAADYFTGPFFGVFSPTVTPYQGITAVPPGHVVVVEGGAVLKPRPFWLHSFHTDEQLSLDDSVELVRTGVERAVARRLVADVPVHSFLSGGLDSTAVLALMAERRRKVTAYTISFPSSEYDESHAARRIAQHYGAHLEIAECSTTALAQSLAPALKHVEIPVANPGFVGKFLLSRHVHATGVKACLTGEGADEVFAGYAWFKLEALWREYERGGPRRVTAQTLYARFVELEKLSEGFHWTRHGLDVEGPHGFGTPSLHQVRARQYGQLLPMLLSAQLREQSRRTPATAFDQTYELESLRRVEPLHASRAVSFVQLASYVTTTLGDRVEMAHSVECRTPYTDRELMEQVNRIPTRHFIDLEQLREKRLLLEAMRPRLPPFLREVRKHAFQSPDWQQVLSTPHGRSLVAEHMSSTAVREAGLFRPAFIAALGFAARNLPRASPLRKKLDTLWGACLGAQVLHAQLIRRPFDVKPLTLVERPPAAQTKPESWPAAACTRTQSSPDIQLQ